MMTLPSTLVISVGLLMMLEPFYTKATQPRLDWRKVKMRAAPLWRRLPLRRHLPADIQTPLVQLYKIK